MKFLAEFKELEERLSARGRLIYAVMAEARMDGVSFRLKPDPRSSVRPRAGAWVVHPGKMVEVSEDGCSSTWTVFADHPARVTSDDYDTRRALRQMRQAVRNYMRILRSHPRAHPP